MIHHFRCLFCGEEMTIKSKEDEAKKKMEHIKICKNLKIKE